MNAAQQKLTQKIFRRLVTPERTRAIVELADLYQLAPDRDEVARDHRSARRGAPARRADPRRCRRRLRRDRPRVADRSLADAAALARRGSGGRRVRRAARRRGEAVGGARAIASGLLWRGEAMEEARRWYAQRPRELVAARRSVPRRGVRARRARQARPRACCSPSTFVVLGGGALAASAAALQIRSAKQQAETNEGIAKQQTDVAKQAADTAKQALAERDKKDAERAAAEAAQKKAEQDALMAHAGEQKEKDLHVADNAEHTKQLEAEKATAIAAQKVAEGAASEAKKAKDSLAVELKKSQAENERLKGENAKLSHTLK